MSENNNLTYYQRNRETILNKAKDKHKNLSDEDKIKKREYAKNRYHNMSKDDKNKAREYAKNRFHDMSEKDKNKAREYVKNRSHNMSEEKKQEYKEYQKKYREASKSKHNNKIAYNNNNNLKVAAI